MISIYELINTGTNEDTKERLYNINVISLLNGIVTTETIATVVRWSEIREKLVSIVKDDDIIRCVISDQLQFEESGKSYLEFESLRKTFPRQPGLVIGGN